MLERPRVLRPVLIAFAVVLAFAVAFVWSRRWWIDDKLFGAQMTSVDTLMQDPAAWIGKTLLVEGVVGPGSSKDGWFGCSYRLVEGWKSVEVQGRWCDAPRKREGRLVYVTGELRRNGTAFELVQGQVSWNYEPIDNWRYLPPTLPLHLTEQAVSDRADAFRRRVAARAPGESKPDGVRLLRKLFMHGCFLRFDGTVGCWHNHQWMGEQQDEPSAITWVHSGPSLTSLELDSYSGAGLSASGEVYWWSAPRTDRDDAHVPRASPGHALRVDIPKAKSVRLGSDACAVLENGTIACWDVRGTPSEKPALVSHLEQLVGFCQVGRDEIHCPPAERLARSSVQALVENEGTLYSHLCLLRDGRVACNGSNWFGELGVARYGTERRDFDEWVPAPVSEPVVAVAAGGRHTCVKLASGWVECWGANEFGQASPFAPLMSSARPLRVARFPLDWQLSAHEDLSCMSRGGAFECWGHCKQLPAIVGFECTTWPG